MEENLKILLCEDDENLGMLLREYLQAKGFTAELCPDGEAGYKAFLKTKFDICVLDVMMPKKDGFTLAQEIRQSNGEIPIIFLTAKTLKDDILEGFKIGADDYITKPFDTELLLYKIKAILQRSVTVETEEQEYFRFSNIYFDSVLRQLKVHDKEYKLSPKENDLLHLLCVHRNDFMPRELALRKIWKKENYFTARSMDVYIAKLRKLLRDDEGVEIINVHGEGFRLVVKH